MEFKKYCNTVSDTEQEG